MGQLSGKTAMITGASRGIGRAIATRFVAEGARVVLCASRLGAHGNLPGTLEEAVAALNAEGVHAAYEVADLADPGARADLISRAESHFGPLDILVNNAAAGKMKLPSEASRDDRNWMFELNLNAPVDLAQQVLPGMRQRGQGWILNISSATVDQPIVPYPDSKQAALIIGPYGATKAALNRYTLALAHEFAGSGIRINTLAPEAIVLTPGAEHVRDIALRRPDMVEPVEMMAEAALALCAGELTGQIGYSRRVLHQLGLPLRSLDGTRVIGDAFTIPDIA